MKKIGIVLSILAGIMSLMFVFANESENEMTTEDTVDEIAVESLEEEKEAYSTVNLNMDNIGNIYISINGEYFYTGFGNVIVDDVTYVPAESFADSLGIDYEEVIENLEVKLTKDDKNLSIFIPSDIVKIGDEYIATGEYSFVYKDVVYVAATTVLSIFEYEYKWDEEDSEIAIVSPNRFDGFIASEYVPGFVEIENAASVSYTEEDLLWLARILQVESGNISKELELAVANVVLNRVADPRFPSTVYDVITQIDSGYVQFPPAHKESFQVLEPNESSYESAQRALEGENNVENALYFNLVPFASKSDDLYKIIDGEYFYN